MRACFLACWFLGYSGTLAAAAPVDPEPVPVTSPQAPPPAAPDPSVVPVMIGPPNYAFTGANAPPGALLLTGPLTVLQTPDLYARDPVLANLFNARYCAGQGLHTHVGFDYLRPAYPSRATSLVISPATAGAFPPLASTGDLVQGSAFVPRVGVTYMFQSPNDKEQGAGVGASGQMFTLHGDLTRTVTGTSGTGTLTASNDLTIGVANILEGIYPLKLGRLDPFRGGPLADCMLIGSFGGRYSTTHQQFNAALVSGPNLAGLTATQNYNGFGMTGSLAGICPLEYHGLALYGQSRGSVLIGQNNRTSRFTTLVSGGPSDGGQLTETRTRLIPVGEFEAGLIWTRLQIRRGACYEALQPSLGKLIWVQAGMTAQVWGGLGLLDAPASSPLQGATFSNGSLVLYGFTIQFGVTF